MFTKNYSQKKKVLLAVFSRHVNAVVASCLCSGILDIMRPVVTVCLQDLNKRQGLALLTKVGESVKHVAGGYKLRARPAEFCAMGEYLDTFSQKLGTIDRIAQRILKEQSGTRPTEDSDCIKYPKKLCFFSL